MCYIQSPHACFSHTELIWPGAANLSVSVQKRRISASNAQKTQFHSRCCGILIFLLGKVVSLLQVLYSVRICMFWHIALISPVAECNCQKQAFLALKRPKTQVSQQMWWDPHLLAGKGGFSAPSVIFSPLMHVFHTLHSFPPVLTVPVKNSRFSL